MPRCLPLLPVLERRFTDWFGADDAHRIARATTRRALRVPSRVDAAGLARRIHALGIETARVPFSSDQAWFVDDSSWPARQLGNLWEHQSGGFYTMDAASLLAVEALDPQPHERVLDLCAAPGGKAAHMSDRMRGTGLIVANDASHARLPGLVNNIDRMGCLNVVMTTRNGAQCSWPFAFDRVLVDAPCSNLGGAHERSRAGQSFADEKSGRLVGLQRDLLAAAFRATKPGGIIVYSTCTLDPRENEGNVDWFVRTHAVDIEPFDPGVGRPGMTSADGETFDERVAGARRIHPGDAGTDGFFVARFRKRANAEAARIARPRVARAVAPDAGVWKEARASWGATHWGDDLACVRTEKRLFAIGADVVDEALSLDPARVGVCAAIWDLHAWRMMFDAATKWGAGTGEAVDVTREEARALLSGESIPREGTRRGEPWHVTVVEGEAIGSSRTLGGVLPSFVPKVRRVPRGSVEHWGLFAQAP